MRKRQLLPVLVLLLALLLTACGAKTETPAAPAEPAGEPAAQSAPAAEPTPEAMAANQPDEPYTAVPYKLFPIHDAGYVGDTMPFVTEDGLVELYYLYDTDRNGQGYHPFYKFSTRNFYDYEDHGMVLNFGQMSDPDPALGTGSILQDENGLYHLFYTGHNDTGNGGKGKECVMHATSTDRENWVKEPEVVMFAPDNYSKDDFRDPEVFWVEQDQCYWMLIAAHHDQLGGVVAQYISPDLKTWEFCGPFFAPQNQFMCECPDLFSIGDKWYLTYSWDCVTYYAMSDSMYGPFHAFSDNILDGRGTTEGAGFVFYAAKTAELNGNIYLCGWHGRAGLSSDSGVYQWAGNILNHQLLQREDGSLGVKAPETLTDYFTVEKPFQAVGRMGKADISGSSVSLSAQSGSYALADLGTRPATMTLECDVTLDAKGRAGFAFGGKGGSEDYTALCLDAGRRMVHYEGYAIEDLASDDPAAYTRFDFSKSDVHHVKLVCENEIVVLYIDNHKALTSRITSSINGAHIALFADGGSASFSNITIKIPG